MVPLEGLSFEHHCDKNRKYCQRDYLLNYFQLHQVEGTAVFGVSYPVGRYLCAILEEGDSPGKENDADEGPAG